MIQDASIKKILTSLFDGSDIKEFRKTPGLKFSTGDGKFQTYDELAKNKAPAVLAAELEKVNQVSIVVDGKERFFKRIVKNNATGNAIAGVTNDSVNADKDGKGFKGMAWLETDATGNTRLNEQGKANVILAFPGFKGSIFGNTPQTEAARSGERGDLYDPVVQVAGFLKTVEKELERQKIKDYEMQVVAYSFGSPNGLMAGAILGDKAKDIFLIDPVTASGALDLLKGMDIQKLHAYLKISNPEISEQEARVVAAEIQKLDKKTASRRFVSFNETDGSPELSNAAMLTVYKADPEGKKTIADNHLENAGSGVAWKAALETFTIKDGRYIGVKDGKVIPIKNKKEADEKRREGFQVLHNSPTMVDKKNGMVGTEEFEYIAPAMIKENGVVSALNTFDPTHGLSNAAYAGQHNAPVASTIEELERIVDPLKKGKGAEKPTEAAAIKTGMNADSGGFLGEIGQVAKVFLQNGVKDVAGITRTVTQLLPKDMQVAMQSFAQSVSGMTPVSLGEPKQPLLVAAKESEKPAGPQV